jgi:hypothetical protein
VAGDAEETLTLEAENWQRVLRVEEAADLGEIHREIIFGALAAYAEQGGDGMHVEVADGTEANLSADAPLLLPGTRIHIQVGGSAKAAVKGLVRTAALFALTGSGIPEAAAPLSIDIVLEVFNKISRLSEEEAEIVRTLLFLRRMKGRLPTEEELARTLPGMDDLDDRLSSLRDRKVIVERDGGLRVVF